LDDFIKLKVAVVIMYENLGASCAVSSFATMNNIKRQWVVSWHYCRYPLSRGIVIGLPGNLVAVQIALSNRHLPAASKLSDCLAGVRQTGNSSAKCKSVRKPHANLPDTTVNLTSASTYFQMLPGPSAATNSALTLCKSILRST
jgi:hypothetical protein